MFLCLKPFLLILKTRAWCLNNMFDGQIPLIVHHISQENLLCWWLNPLCFINFSISPKPKWSQVAAGEDEEAALQLHGPENGKAKDQALGQQTWTMDHGWINMPTHPHDKDDVGMILGWQPKNLTGGFNANFEMRDLPQGVKREAWIEQLQAAWLLCQKSCWCKWETGDDTKHGFLDELGKVVGNSCVPCANLAQKCQKNIKKQSQNSKDTSQVG